MNLTKQKQPLVKYSNYMLLALASLTAFSACQPGQQQAKEQRKASEDSLKAPNVLFILIDDMGATDLACYGNQYHETPNIDKIAQQGLIFSDAYAACPVSSPTRASILTGRYPAEIGLTDWIPGRQASIGLEKDKKLKVPKFNHHLPLTEITVAEALKKQNYRTASIGKWHLGGEGFLPQDQGFDINIGGTHAGMPPSFYYPYRHNDWQRPDLKELAKPKQYLPDMLTDHAIDFISQNKEKPFFLYMAYYLVHIPIEGRKDLIDKYTQKAQNLKDTTHNNPHYAAMIEALDDNVGRLLQTLDSLQIADNTLIIFFSDNGGLATREGPRTPATNNKPYRAGKGHLYEGGIREPLLMRWPAVIKAGQRSDMPVSSVDFFPTIAEATNAEAKHVSGISLMPLLKGENMERSAIYWHYPHYSNQGGKPGAAIREGDYKLIRWFENDSLELYNLKTDLAETQNLVENHSDKAQTLNKKLSQWLKTSNAQMPEANPIYQPF